MRTAVLLLASVVAGIACGAERPNVVYMLADDVGWGDLSVHGGGVPTPNIDRLFEQGVELTQFMGWCVCSPTRAQFLTGRHPFRVGTGPETGGELDPQETTIAEAFKANGYCTGVFGKWHNGNDPDTPEYRAAFAEAFRHMPNKKPTFGYGVNVHGFDEAWVYYGGGGDYFNRRTVKGRGPVSWWHNREYHPHDEGYTDDLITQHAIEFMRANRDRPFFCYVSFHLVHAPLQAKKEDLAAIPPELAAGLPAANPNTTAEEKRIHAAMLRSLDNNVGAIVAELRQLGLIDNTILVFTSDNGAMEAGSSLPLRGHKHTIYDGGVRLPTVIHWPKGGLIGGWKWDGLCGAEDMLPTLIAMAGCRLPPTRALDGKNVWPALRERRESPRESYYWAWRNEDAIRTARWKLHRFFDHYELYDIRQDETESTNLADKYPEVVRQLEAKMDAWAESLGAALSHRPAPQRYHKPPAPEGEVLGITVTISEEAKPGDRLVVPIATWNGRVYATDWLEFDIAFSPGSAKRCPYLSPLQGNNATGFTPLFRAGVGVDQFGRQQSAGPGLADKNQVWEHRIVGLCSFAPRPLGKYGVVFTGAQAGTITVYLDNVRIRHADGTVSPIWCSGEDTRSVKISPSGVFKDLQIKVVDASEVK